MKYQNSLIVTTIAGKPAPKHDFADDSWPGIPIPNRIL